MANKVSDIMTKPVTMIREDETLRDAAERLASDNIGVLPITDKDNQLKGVITDRDIVVQAVARGKDPSSMQARELEIGEVITLRPDDSIEHACDLMAQRQVRRLPVVQNGTIVGIVSQADVAKNVTPEKAGRMLTSISSG